MKNQTIADKKLGDKYERNCFEVQARVFFDNKWHGWRVVDRSPKTLEEARGAVERQRETREVTSWIIGADPTEYRIVKVIATCEIVG